MNTVVIEWRCCSQWIFLSPRDRHWTRHSRVATNEAEAKLHSLLEAEKCAVPPNIFEFRIKPKEGTTEQVNAPLGMWIRNAIENGGTLRIRRNKNGWYQADMFWPKEAIESVGKTLESALQELNESLQEDAAQEMLNNPNSGV